MNAKPVTFEAPEESIVTIDEIAANLGVDRETVVREAVATYLADYEQLKADLEESTAEIDAGNFLTHEEVVARFEDRVRRTKAA